jgi:hypothetical protein
MEIMIFFKRIKNLKGGRLYLSIEEEIENE